MEVKLNKTNNQKYVTIPKENQLKEGDKVKVSKIEPLTEEQLKKLVDEDPKIQDLYKRFEEVNKNMWEDTSWEFIEKIKDKLGIQTEDEGEGYEMFKLKDFSIEYLWGEGFNDDFGEAHIPFCNNGVGFFKESYFKQILTDNNMMDKMVKYSKEIAIIQIYTDLVESYHRKRIEDLTIAINKIFDYPKITKNGANLFYIEYKDLIINCEYGDTYFVVKQDEIKIYL